MYIPDSRPVYVQLIDRIYTMVLSGQYPPGAKLPTVRELAELMQANPNTVQKALYYLEEQKLIYTQRTVGKFITEDKDVIERARGSLARAYIIEFFQKMYMIGIDVPEAKKMISEKED
ncbi:MAG: GntR family transcriptional regulator [Clostridia bacterium]|nr:GntR family transcriptional regulator [Clostridia bacterium]